MKPWLLLLCILPVLVLAGCKRTDRNEWADIDYARIARENYQRENDTQYVPPNVLGCADDDLHNCPTGSYRSPYR
jgi:hypothetical protein